MLPLDVSNPGGTRGLYIDFEALKAAIIELSPEMTMMACITFQPVPELGT